MNSSINIANISPSKTSEASVVSSTNTSQEGLNSAETSDSAASTETFQESIKKAYDESKANTEAESSEKIDDEVNGKNLPLVDDFPELSAQDDRSLLLEGIYLNGQLPANNESLTQNTTVQLPANNKSLTQNMATQPQSQSQSQSLPLEINIENDVELNQLTAPLKPGTNVTAGDTLNVMASQVRQFLKMEAGTDDNKIKLATVRTGNATTTTAAGNTLTLNSDIDQPLAQSSNILPLNTAQIEVTADKTLTLTNPTNQQTLLPNIQSSLLLQTASAQGQAATNIEALPLVVNTTANSLSTINMQSVPQAEITESFARPAWSQAMGKQVLLMVNQNISTAEIRLNPANLGPIEVLIDMSEEKVSVSMSSRHAIVREAMEQALPKLREMLDENGFTLADADISKRSFAEQREQDADNERKNISEEKTDLPATSEISGPAIRQASMATGVVDYYI